MALHPVDHSCSGHKWMHVMNLSMTYSMMPDLSVHRETVRPASYFPVVRQSPAPSMDSQNLDRQGPSTYKYYVIASGTEDRVYNRSKSMETMYHQTRGRLVDIYA